MLDVGTGAGDVALLAAEIVGPSGHVVGMDSDAQIIRAAFAPGLPEPTMRLGSYVGGGVDSVAYAWMAESVRRMLPLIVKLGVATEDEVDVDTLADRLRAEAVGADAVLKGPDLVSAWTRI